MIPRIISVSNLKGGAGKSTIAVNLACALRARTGVDCILVDADRQATALSWAENGALGVRVTSRVLHEAKPDDSHPGIMWVAQIRMLANKNPSVIIDLPPGLEYSLAAVAAISDLIVVPVNPSGVDFHSTARFIKLVQKTREIRGSDKPGCIIVPNRLDRRTTIARKMSLYEQFGEPIAPAIGMRAAFVYAFDQGRWVGEISPRSAAHKEIEQLVSAVIGEAGDSGAEVAAPATQRTKPVRAKRAGRRKRSTPDSPSSAAVAEDAGQPQRRVGDQHDGGERDGHRPDQPDHPGNGGLEKLPGDAAGDHRVDGDRGDERADGDAHRHPHADPDGVPFDRASDPQEGLPVDESAAMKTELVEDEAGDDAVDRHRAQASDLAEAANGRGDDGAEGPEPAAASGEDPARRDDEETDGGDSGDVEDLVDLAPAHGAFLAEAEGTADHGSNRASLARSE